MIKLIRGGVYYMENSIIKENSAFMVESKKQTAVKGTITYGVLTAHNNGTEENLKIKFDELVSGNTTCVNVLRAAHAAGLSSFPVPYALTSLSAAKKYGGYFVPANLASIHGYMHEARAKSGAMILGSDSRTRYGAAGTLAFGENEREVVKQLFGKTYDLKKPAVIAVYMRGKPKKGVGPHDVALAILAATFKKGFLKNGILEFIGPGIKNLSMDYRSGIDVMTAETGCLSSVWETDEATRDYFKLHGREGDFKELKPAQPAYYNGAVICDLSRIEPMIALPCHPSNAYTIAEFLRNAGDILAETEKAAGANLNLRNAIKNGKVYVNQGAIAGCVGGSYENIAEASEILKTGAVNADFSLSVYPRTQPVFKSLADNGYVSSLLGSGAVINHACDCLNGLSVRSTYGNFVALMDARSIAATAANGGAITPATQIDYVKKVKKYNFDGGIYGNKVYRGFGKPNPEEELICGENITDYPQRHPLANNLLIKAVSVPDDAAAEESPQNIPDGVGIAVAPDTAYASAVIVKKNDKGCEQSGGLAVIAEEYPNGRCRSNLINRGVLPLTCRKFDFADGDYVYIENVTELLKSGCTAFPAKHISGGKIKNIMLDIEALSEEEIKVILDGGLINYCKNSLK